MTTYDDAQTSHGNLDRYLTDIDRDLTGRNVNVSDSIALGQAHATNNLALAVLALVEEVNKARGGGGGLPTPSSGGGTAPGGGGTFPGVQQRSSS